jgi:hypothetical protein
MCGKENNIHYRVSDKGLTALGVTGCWVGSGIASRFCEPQTGRREFPVFPVGNERWRHWSMKPNHQRSGSFLVVERWAVRRWGRGCNAEGMQVYEKCTMSKKAIVFEMCDFDYQSNICFHCVFNICSSKILYWGWNIRLNMLNDWTCFSLSISQCLSVYKNKWLIRERKINRDFGEWFPSLGSRALRRTTSSFHPR